MENKLVTEKLGKDLKIGDTIWDNGEWIKIGNWATIKFLNYSKGNCTFICLVSTKEAKDAEKFFYENCKYLPSLPPIVDEKTYYKLIKIQVVRMLAEYAQQFQQGTYTREELIAKLKSVIEAKQFEDWDETYKALADSLLGLQSEWVRVEKELPTKVCNVYVYADGKVRSAIYSFEDKSFWYGVIPAENVTHWRLLTLPSPPINKSLNQSNK